MLDFFLFNSQRGAAINAKPYRELSIELRDALLARKRAVPGLRVLVISDPINDVYGALPSRDLAALRGAGIDVVSVDLDSLRDSNPIYSAFWRMTMRWWSGDGRGEATFAEPAGRRPGPRELRRLGPAAQLQGQPPQGDHRRRRHRRDHRHRHLRQPA